MRPVATKKFSIGRGRFVKFYLWPTQKEVSKQYAKYDGAADGYSWGEIKARGEAVFGFCLYTKSSGNAQIHLSLSHMGAGLLAHELQHLMDREYLRRLNYYNRESLPVLAERLTRGFWRWYYELFPGEQG